MKQVTRDGDEQLIALLIHSEPWKAMERNLQQMEIIAFESLLHEPETGPVVAAKVEIIRQIMRCPEECAAKG